MYVIYSTDLRLLLGHPVYVYDEQFMQMENRMYRENGHRIHIKDCTDILLAETIRLFCETVYKFVDVYRADERNSCAVKNTKRSNRKILKPLKSRTIVHS